MTRACLGECRLGGAAVFFGAVPAGERARRHLVDGLLVRGLGYRDLPAAGADATRLEVRHDAVGRPWLVDQRTGAEHALSISFAHPPARSWAALARGGRVGIDVADASEFQPPYPYGRVFTDAEMNLALPLNEDRLPSAAALLWALKEAAVKALGCGFRGFDYRGVEVVARVPDGDDHLFAVSADRTTVTAWARREKPAWLALAVTHAEVRRAAGHDVACT